MAKQSPQQTAATKVKAALRGFTFHDKVRIMADVLRDLGFSMFSASMLDALDKLDRDI